MGVRAQQGFTLIESVVAAAVAAVAICALFGAIGEFGRFASHQAGPVRSAATLLAERTLRVAQDAWKYGSPGSAPAGAALSTIPLNAPNGARTAPVSVTTSVTGSVGSAQISVTVLYTPDPDHPQDPGSVTVSGEARVKAPLPGSTVAPASLVPQPTGAP